MARPRKRITSKDIETIEKLAGLGLNQADIAEVLGFSGRTLRRRINEDERVLAAYKRGRAKGHEFAAKCLRNMMLSGEVAAVIFYLKTQCGWSVEKSESSSVSAEQVCEKIKEASVEFNEMHVEVVE